MAAARKLRDRISTLTATNGATAPAENGAMAAARKLRDQIMSRRSASNGAHAAPRSFRHAAISRGFAWMFSGARLPAPRLLDLVLGNGE
jgi:hypothetical protein